MTNSNDVVTVAAAAAVADVDEAATTASSSAAEPKAKRHKKSVGDDEPDFDTFVQDKSCIELIKHFDRFVPIDSGSGQNRS